MYMDYGYVDVVQIDRDHGYMHVYMDTRQVDTIMAHVNVDVENLEVHLYMLQEISEFRHFVKCLNNSGVLQNAW